MAGGQGEIFRSFWMARHYAGAHRSEEPEKHQGVILGGFDVETVTQLSQIKSADGVSSSHAPT